MLIGLYWFAMVYLYNGITNFVGYLKSKLSSKNSSCTIKSIADMDYCVHPFSEGISLKFNLIAQLQSELAFKNITVQHISDYPTGPPQYIFRISMQLKICCTRKMHLFMQIRSLAI